MLRAIKQFFCPPVFPDDEAKTRLARILYTLVTSLLVVISLGLIATLLIFVEKGITTSILLISLGILLTINILVKRGHLWLGSILYIFALWSAATITLYLGNGTSGSQLGFYLALTVTAGILLSVRWAVALTILNSLVVLGFALLEINEYPFPHLFPEPPLTRWFNFSVTLLLTITPVYRILTSLSEALGRAQQENEQRKEVELLLRESERKFRDITNNIPGLVFQLRVPDDGSSYFSFVSPRGMELLDLAVGLNSPDFDLGANFHPEDKPAFLASIEQAVANRSNWHFEGRLLKSQGNNVWVQGIASPTSTEDELVFDGILLDVTERKRLEEQLRQAQKMEAVGRLSGGIAHDFNNILVPITGYVELAMVNLAPGDKLYSYLKRVQDAAERAADLTHQILAFSRKQVLKMQVLDLNTVVTDFKKMVQRLIGEDIEFETFLTPDLYRVKADQGQLEQVLMNLVVNARDAMPTGGKLTIETANVHLDKTYAEKYADIPSPGRYVMLAVSDTGHGMDAETQQQIFEPFFTTKAQGEGTGLGLATVFGIVKQHGGNIWVYSELDKGTTFKVYLPQTSETEQSVEISQAEAETLSGTETILVVEDEEMVRKLVCETLAAYGYKIIEAQNVNDGLQRASEYKEPIHLLLTDVIMPEMNGRELYDNVVAIYPTIKVLYMSGYTDNVIVHHGILEEGIDFLQKPFSVQSLTKKVRQVLS